MAKNTEFRDFSHRLATVFKGKKTAWDFVREIFNSIYLDSGEDDSPIDNLEDRTLKGYYYGNSDIGTIAVQISSALDTKYFEEYLELEVDDSIEILCDEFRDKIPDIDAANYQEKIATLLKDIIVRAANKASKASKRQEKFEQKKEFPAESNDLKIKYGDALVMEANGICQNDNCANLLYVPRAMAANYEVVVIDPDENSDDPNNLIAMCPTCAIMYTYSLTPQKITSMKERKKMLSDNSSLDFELSNARIEEGLPKVLAKIAGLPLPEEVDLNYDPVKISDKIDPTEYKMLCFNVKTMAAGYYSRIDELLKESERLGDIDFDIFCMQIRYEFNQLKKQSTQLTDIFHAMVKWLVDISGEEIEPCETLISYFVQKCEVFDVIPK